VTLDIDRDEIDCIIDYCLFNELSVTANPVKGKLIMSLLL